MKTKSNTGWTKIAEDKTFGEIPKFYIITLTIIFDWCMLPTPSSVKSHPKQGNGWEMVQNAPKRVKKCNMANVDL